MNIARTTFAFSICLALGWQAVSAQWSIPVNAPLLTKWSKDVSPTNALPEYPRPQMVREDWMNLNGLWQFAEANDGEAPPFGKELVRQILVPYPIESALSGVMVHASRLWYRRTVDLPKNWSGRRVLLHFGAVDWEANVYVNGKAVGSHKGGYDPFAFDVTDALKPGGPQEIIVAVFDPTDQGDQPRGKQVLKPSGIWYTPTTGLWQTVWLEPVPLSHISSLKIVPDVDSGSLRLSVEVSGSKPRSRVRAVVVEGNQAVAEATGKVDEVLTLSLKEPRLWSPDDPYLYQLNVELVEEGRKVDAVGSYFGMRKVEIGKDERGLNRILLNGKFVMQVGPLDQGFWPDGIYTAPTDEALKYDIEMTKKLGFNMARKHVKVEPERWYYWADKLGLLVWQDMPSANNKTDDSKRQFETELGQLVATHFNHPSIIMWVVFNEGWGQYDTERLTGWVKELDPSRLVNNASGWTDKKVGDVLDIHNYPAPKAPEPDSVRAIVLGEFGGLGLAIEGHTWKKEHWGYQGMQDADQLTLRYEKFLKKVYQFKDNPGLSAAVYTQTTDVEVECNGLMTYDRAIVKPALERVVAVNRGDTSNVPPDPIIKAVVPTSELEGKIWKYTLSNPGVGWQDVDYVDTAWIQGAAGFGTKGTPGAIVRTEWKTSDIWMRSEVVIPDGEFVSLHFRMHHDDDAEVYVNGILAGIYSGRSREYEEAPVTLVGLKALKPGKNTIAVHCRQIRGGQYIDVGIVDVIPVQPKQ